MEDRFTVTIEEDFWRKATPYEDNAIKTWSGLVLKEENKRLLSTGVVLTFLIVVGCFAIGVYGQSGDYDVLFGAAMSVLAVPVCAFLMHVTLSGNIKRSQDIKNGDYLVTEAVVVDKDRSYFAAPRSYATVRYGSGSEVSVRVFENDRDSIYDHLKPDTSVLLIKFSDNKYGYLGSEFDLIMIELFIKKEDRHEG